MKKNNIIASFDIKKTILKNKGVTMKAMLVLVSVMLVASMAWGDGGCPHSVPICLKLKQPLTITNTSSNDSFTVNDEAGDTTPFVIDADGNVGIGTGSPVQTVTVYQSADSSGLGTYGYDDKNTNFIELHIDQNGSGGVNSNGNAVYFQIGNSTTFAYTPSGILFYDNKTLAFGDGYDYSMVYSSLDDTLQWLNGRIVGTDVRMTLNSTGQFGIGTESPTEILEVNGNIYVQDNDKSLYGTSKDAEIYFNATNLIIDPDAVDTGKVYIGVTGDDTINAGAYEVAGVAGLSATYTFGGGGTGDIATMTFTSGILTAVTTVP